MSRTIAHSLEPHFPFPVRIGNSVEHCREWLRKWIKGRGAYRQTLFELSVCSDRQLNDMGIARCGIRRIAREARDMAEEA